MFHVCSIKIKMYIKIILLCRDSQNLQYYNVIFTSVFNQVLLNSDGKNINI